MSAHGQNESILLKIKFFQRSRVHQQFFSLLFFTKLLFFRACDVKQVGVEMRTNEKSKHQFLMYTMTSLLCARATKWGKGWHFLINYERSAAMKLSSRTHGISLLWQEHFKWRVVRSEEIFYIFVFYLCLRRLFIDYPNKNEKKYFLSEKSFSVGEKEFFRSGN
jgi:hypothetical protein